MTGVSRVVRPLTRVSLKPLLAPKPNFTETLPIHHISRFIYLFFFCKRLWFLTTHLPQIVSKIFETFLNFHLHVLHKLTFRILFFFFFSILRFNKIFSLTWNHMAGFVFQYANPTNLFFFFQSLPEFLSQYPSQI